jgi:hypothetical protein
MLLGPLGTRVSGPYGCVPDVQCMHRVWADGVRAFGRRHGRCDRFVPLSRTDPIEEASLSAPCWPTSAWLVSTRGPQHDPQQAVLAPRCQWRTSWCEMRGVWCYSNGAGQNASGGVGTTLAEGSVSSEATSEGTRGPGVPSLELACDPHPPHALWRQLASQSMLHPGMGAARAGRIGLALVRVLARRSAVQLRGGHPRRIL